MASIRLPRKVLRIGSVLLVSYLTYQSLSYFYARSHNNSAQRLRMAESAENVEDIQPDSNAVPSSTTSNKRNAFDELMAPKPKSVKSESSAAAKPKKQGSWRQGLLPYIQHPELISDRSVIRYNADVVLIQDGFPKATVHLLLLPRSSKFYELHPTLAFEDAEFLSMVKQEAAIAAKLAAAELRRKLSKFSATEKARNEAMEALDCEDELPAGRDYLSEIQVGIHAHPSMHHLHVHIISRDMVSDKVKHRKHYNSFNTPFFIPLADFPLAKDDPRRNTEFQNGNLKKEFVCWRCKQEIKGDSFAELKRHLEEEFEGWKKE
ncbi:HIT-like domain containing protein [Naviculisporaceae sp. PSN 640]